MESSGTCCTGPVGPEGNGGCSTFFTFFWLWAVTARTGFPGHRKATPKNAVHTILLSFDPVLITATPHRAREPSYFGGTLRGLPYTNFTTVPGPDGISFCLENGYVPDSCTRAGTRTAPPRGNRIGSQPFRA